MPGFRNPGAGGPPPPHLLPEAMAPGCLPLRRGLGSLFPLSPHWVKRLTHHRLPAPWAFLGTCILSLFTSLGAWTMRLAALRPVWPSLAGCVREGCELLTSGTWGFLFELLQLRAQNSPVVAVDRSPFSISLNELHCAWWTPCVGINLQARWLQLRPCHEGLGRPRAVALQPQHQPWV